MAQDGMNPEKAFVWAKIAYFFQSRCTHRNKSIVRQHAAVSAYGIHYSFECIRVVEREVGEYFSVEVYSLLVECMDQAGVGSTVGAGAGVDTCDPKAAEGAFFGTAVAIRVAHGFIQGIFSYGEYVFTCTEEAAGGFEHFLPSLPGCNGVY